MVEPALPNDRTGARRTLYGVTGVPSEPYTFYMGSTGGGVWKTTDAGHSWKNVSDGFFQVASMGAIEVSLSDPKIVDGGEGVSKNRSYCLDGDWGVKAKGGGKALAFYCLRGAGEIPAVRVH